MPIFCQGFLSLLCYWVLTCILVCHATDKNQTHRNRFCTQLSGLIGASVISLSPIGWRGGPSTSFLINLLHLQSPFSTRLAMYDHVHPSRLPQILEEVQSLSKYNNTATSEIANKEQPISMQQSQRGNQETPLRINFFDLPREIRDRVYHHIWKNTILPFYQRTDSYGLPGYQNGLLLSSEYAADGQHTHHTKGACNAYQIYCRCGHRAPARPTWNYTCAQLYTEAAEQFYRHSQITKSSIQRDTVHTQPIQNVPRQSISGSRFAFPHLSLARRVSINLEEGNAWVNRVSKMNDGLY
jgi:hypothetical protein